MSSVFFFELLLLLLELDDDVEVEPFVCVVLVDAVSLLPVELLVPFVTLPMLPDTADR